MAINLELPRKLKAVAEKGHQGAAEMLRPISRKYDLAEHAYPSELDTLASLFEGVQESNTVSVAGAGFSANESKSKHANVNGANMSALLNALEVSWGDVALLLTVPYQGLGNAAISAVATKDQLSAGKVWAAMAITEPSFGSDSAAVTTTAVLDGDEYVINGEKIFVTAGSRATHIVVWATVDKSLGRAAIKSFVVPREHPASSSNAWSTSWASRPPTPRSSASTTAGSRRITSWAIRRSRWTRVLAGSWRPSTTPARWWPPWRSAWAVPPWRSCGRS